MNSTTKDLFSQNDAVTTPMPYSLENYEIAQVESAPSAYKLCITFNHSEVYVNSELLKRAPEMTYVLFLIDRAARKLILRPCDQNERDAVRIRTMNSDSTKPRHIRSSEFSNRIFDCMEWDISCRYRIAGNIVFSGSKTLIVFDLCEAVAFKLSNKDTVVRIPPVIPSSESSFGATVANRLENPLVTQFTDDTTVPIDLSNNSEATTSGGPTQ